MFGSSSSSTSKLATLGLAALLAAASVSAQNAIGESCNANSECSSGNCQGYSGFCDVGSGNTPTNQRPCTVAADCSGYNSYCGTEFYGTPNECYFSGAACSGSNPQYEDPACPAYQAACPIVVQGTCAAAAPGASGGARQKKRSHASQQRQSRSQPLTAGYKVKKSAQMKRSKALCPSDYSACPIKGTSGVECVNILEELNSCGACGNDCEAQAKPGQAVTCSAGQCIFGPEP